jgi:hypothetical protein
MRHALAVAAVLVLFAALFVLGMWAGAGRVP